MWAWLVPLLLRAGCLVLDPRFLTAAPECRPPAVGVEGGESDCSAEELVLHKLRLCADAGIFKVSRETPTPNHLGNSCREVLCTFPSVGLVCNILLCFASTQSPHGLSIAYATTKHHCSTAYTDEPERSLWKRRVCLPCMHSCRRGDAPTSINTRVLNTDEDLKSLLVIAGCVAEGR